ncbi:3-hydroxyisobutyrate dehydrogenase-like beta-hydroxyacid dehydrogenase [Azospirillum agricola]|uniref:NAD-binding protein n=1 Tax=Azospirillum agricola TaxID=1720247 RepID=UPI002D7F0FDC|nr:NAD-binding protein [Azospirillum agricola]MBP2229388.1 3-hydroxyisobutyrate dehydrogenase-like beta-hydroxyacid dehydrogenase [Azospirillum agricola]
MDVIACVGLGNMGGPFAASLMLKDLRLAKEAALAANATTPLGFAAVDVYSLFADSGHGGDDFSAIVRYLRDGAHAGATD